MPPPPAQVPFDLTSQGPRRLCPGTGAAETGAGRRGGGPGNGVRVWVRGPGVWGRDPCPRSRPNNGGLGVRIRRQRLGLRPPGAGDWGRGCGVRVWGGGSKCGVEAGDPGPGYRVEAWGTRVRGGPDCPPPRGRRPLTVHGLSRSRSAGRGGGRDVRTATIARIPSVVRGLPGLPPLPAAGRSRERMRRSRGRGVAREAGPVSLPGHRGGGRRALGSPAGLRKSKHEPEKGPGPPGRRLSGPVAALARGGVPGWAPPALRLADDRPRGPSARGNTRVEGNEGTRVLDSRFTPDQSRQLRNGTHWPRFGDARLIIRVFQVRSRRRARLLGPEG